MDDHHIHTGTTGSLLNIMSSIKGRHQLRLEIEQDKTETNNYSTYKGIPLNISRGVPYNPHFDVLLKKRYFSYL